MPDKHHELPLSAVDIQQFIADGFVGLDRAFPRELADECRAILWRDLPCDPEEKNDFSSWRVNVTSRDRALLMLFLFSDVGMMDAPTRIRVGSHREMARLLEPAGEPGMRWQMDLETFAADPPEALATGEADRVYLCHPFLVHAAQRHHGTTPRFVAQPPLHPAEPFRLERADGDYSPVEIAIRQALRENPD